MTLNANVAMASPKGGLSTMYLVGIGEVSVAVLRLLPTFGIGPHA